MSETAARPWLKSYPDDVPHSLEPYPDVSLYSLLESAAGRHADRAAIAFLGKHIPYRRLLAEVERCSAMLAELGVRKGDRVGLVLPNCPQYVIAYYAIVRLGAIVVGNNPLYAVDELRHQLIDAGIEVCITLEQLYPLTAEAIEGTPVRELVVTKLTDYMKFPLNKLAPIKFRKDAKKAGDPWPPVPRGTPVKWWNSLMKAAGTPPPPAEIDPATDPAGFIYTGGTTGRAKGAMLTHRNLVANALQSAVWSGCQEGEEVVMCVLPFFHSYGMTTELNTAISRGGTLVLVPRFELHMVLQQIQKEKPTLFPGVPRLYMQINDAEESKKYDLSSIRACVSGAAPLPTAVAESFERLTGGALVEGYGLTEASPVTHANPLRGKRKAGSIGMPVPDTDCRIVELEEPDKEVEPGSPGELLIRGPQVMLGYWNRPDETALMIRDGWLHTGDIAEMDEDGYFKIVDRLKDMILVSGFNVYPTEVEDALYRNPKIAKCAVVGLPDPKTGEAVKAYIVLRPGETATAEEIVADAREHLTGYRVPKLIEFRDSLPETLIGKVLRRVLLEEEKQKAAAAPPAST